MGTSEIITALEASGPYAIIVFLGIAYWRKDKQYTDMMMQMLKIVQDKTTADIKLKTAINGLRDVIMVLTGKKSD